MTTIIHRYFWSWAVLWLLMMPLWFAFAGRTEFGELLVGAAAAALAATGDAAIRRQRFGEFRPKPSWLLEFWREPGYVLKETAMIFLVLLKRLFLRTPPHDQLSSVKFHAGGNTARSAARRALALTLATIPPNSIVIGIDQEKHCMLVHQLQETDVSKAVKRMGAK